MLLVVEDDADVREALVGLLSTEGFRVASCANGKEALEWLRRPSQISKPDVILLDLMMPVMDGWQFRLQQRQDPDLAGIPVLAMSADPTAKAAAIDASAYLRKPVDYDRLIRTIERLVVASEHRELEARLAQTDRLRSLGTLVAGLAHEINNPLSYVLLNLAYVAAALPKLLPNGERSQEVLAAFEHARGGTERIRDIVRSLQTFAGPENEARAPLDVAFVLDSTLALVESEIRRRGVLIKEYAPVPKVVANQARLGQVFMNLLLNAAQALPEVREGRSEVRVVLRSLTPERVTVEVEDNGHGIPPELRGRIFEPFFTTKPVGVGMGMGLASCHGIVSSLGGTLSFKSEEGRGTTFRVELPAEGAA